MKQTSIVNLTPHPINIGERNIPPCGKVARVAVVHDDAGTHDGVALVRGTYGEVTGLPTPQAGALYIVSSLVRCALPHRTDLASPTKLVRDEQGRIVGCAALEVN